MGWVGVDNLSDLQRLQMPAKREAGEAALKLMDEHLAGRSWFVGDQPSLADICLFAYTHVAGDAEFDLQLYPHVVQCLERLESQPRFLPMSA
jgi:glutathione S-transferase